MANPEHPVLKQGVGAWNKWRQANPDIKPNLFRADLYGANLHRANLRGASLVEADLREASLVEADLRGATLSEARLVEADLRGANLYGATLGGADLRGASLRGADLRKARLSKVDLSEVSLVQADLRGASLYGATLGGADFGRAILLETVFSNTYLAEAKGLDTCHHEGPSTLDFRTLQLSGPLPPAFLRGCGLPDLLIDYLPDLLNQPIQYYSCFISYSSKDKDFTQRLYADLQNKGVRCWFAPKDIQGGRKIYQQIGEAIRLYEKLLLVLSKNSMNSEWVKTEIAEARQREKREKRQVLFPIRLVSFETIQQ